MAFFKLNQPKGFNHKPIYYDQDKEFHDEIVANAKKSLGIADEKGEYKPNIKGKMRQGGDDKVTFNFRRTVERKSTSRLITLVVLFALVVLFISKI